MNSIRAIWKLVAKSVLGREIYKPLYEFCVWLILVFRDEVVNVEFSSACIVDFCEFRIRILSVGFLLGCIRLVCHHPYRFVSAMNYSGWSALICIWIVASPHNLRFWTRFSEHHSQTLCLIRCIRSHTATLICNRVELLSADGCFWGTTHWVCCAKDWLSILWLLMIVQVATCGCGYRFHLDTFWLLWDYTNWILSS